MIGNCSRLQSLLATTLTRRLARLSNVSWVWHLENIDELPRRHVEVDAAMSFCGRFVGNPYLGITSGLPVIRHLGHWRRVHAGARKTLDVVPLVDCMLTGYGATLGRCEDW